MENKNAENHWLPASIQHAPTKELLERIEKKLGEDKEIAKEKKEIYTRVIREMNYTMGKTVPNWPAEIEKTVDNLKSILMEFDKTLVEMSKGSSFFCGSSTSPKQLDNIFNRLVGYERIFDVIRPFQDKQVRDDIVAKYELEREKMDASRSKTASRRDVAPPEPAKPIEIRAPEANVVEKCKNCELLLAVSLCPNGYIAKKLIKELPDT
jgi:hypothetical protein